MQGMAKNKFHDGPGPSQRQLRVGELIRRSLSELLTRGDLHEPELSGMSITVGEVRATPDLKRATCFVLPLGGGDEETMLAALRRAKPAIRFLLEDIVAYGSEAVETVGDRDAGAILADRLREHAVLRTVQIVGEAAAQILKARPEGIADLELRDAAGFRNVLVHGYAKVRMERVVVIVRQSLPPLIAGARTVLGEKIE